MYNFFDGRPIFCISGLEVKRFPFTLLDLFPVWLNRPQLQRPGNDQEEGRGAVVYQQQEGRGIGILNKIRAYALQEGADAVEANERLDLPVDARDYRQCAEVLLDPRSLQTESDLEQSGRAASVEEAGLEIVERVSIEVESSEPAARYLDQERKDGHLLELIPR